jgi:hypothetical protein
MSKKHLVQHRGVSVNVHKLTAPKNGVTHYAEVLIMRRLEPGAQNLPVISGCWLAESFENST